MTSNRSCATKLKATTNMNEAKSLKTLLTGSLVLVTLTFIQLANCWAQHLHHQTYLNHNNHHQPYQFQHQRTSIIAARRAADDSRPILRLNSRVPIGHNLDSAESVEAPIVVGRFKAPAPEQFVRHRFPKASDYSMQTVGASYRVADLGSSSDGMPEKIVHGIVASESRQNRRQQPQTVERTVGAKIQVSDEGLNYPPSKLSADIYGNVAEIVTAPPDAVDNDFLMPQSSRFSNSRP